MQQKKKIHKNNWLDWFKTPVGISIIIFISIFSLFAFYAKSFNTKQHPTGDEPHYLMVTQSLIKDRDIDLLNNYKNLDYLAYFPALIDNPHIAFNSARGGSYPVGGIGISILLIPFFLIKGRLGTIICANLIGALLSANLFLLFWERTKNKVLSILLALIGILTIPLSIYSFQIFPELLAALIIIYAFRKLPDSFWPILPLAFLPWIHFKYFLVVLVFGIFLIIYKKYYYLIPLILSTFGLFFYYKYFYSGLLPFLALPGGANPENVWTLTNVIFGTFGLFVDRQFGLLAWSPLYLFFFFAVASWWKTDALLKQKKWLWLAVILVLFLPSALFRYWQGGWSPSPRYLVPLIPLFLLPIAYLLNKIRDFVTVLFFGILSGVSLFISWWGLSSPSLLYGTSSLTNNFIAKIEATNILPSFMRVELKDWLLFFLLVIFTLLVALYYNRRLIKEG